MADKGKIAVFVKGGLVQEMRASKDIAKLLSIEVYDLDEPGFMTDDEENEINITKEQWQEIEADENMIVVY